VCGNFGFMGFENGSVVKFNLQSGIVRERSSEADYHDGPITGIKADPMNRILITTGMDGQVKMWDFFQLKLIQTITIDDSAALYNLTMNSVNLF
jgi:U3 small nucleolar RNA-associated protein 21